jgi:nitrogen fixation/metabolism regulation signal transduction histidine kinase
MAKQVAHEIKKNLTPMRLTSQFSKENLTPEDPEHTKNERLLETLIQQIDTHECRICF